MKLPESTEWVLHAVTSLAQLGPGGMASAAQLAAHHDVPAAYLAKQLQSLVRAGVLKATTGPRGGFRLARPAEKVTLLQIVEAVDGGSPFYTCNEIRQRGRGAVPPEQCRRACALAARMAEAEAAWRQSLATVTVAGIVASLPRGVPEQTRTLLARPQGPTQPQPLSPRRGLGGAVSAGAVWAGVSAGAVSAGVSAGAVSAGLVRAEPFGTSAPPEVSHATPAGRAATGKEPR